MSRAVMQQALEALEKATRFMSDSDYKKLNQAIGALRAALAEPEQKVWCDCGDSIEPDSGAKCGNCVAGDSAEPERQWVSLTEQEMYDLFFHDQYGPRLPEYLVNTIKCIEAALKEKNT